MIETNEFYEQDLAQFYRLKLHWTIIMRRALMFIFVFLVCYACAEIFFNRFFSREPVRLQFFMFIFFFLLFAGTYAKWRYTKFFVKSDYVARKNGIFFPKFVIYKVTDELGIRVYQGFWGKMFKYGTIEFITRLSDEKHRLTNVRNPYYAYRIIKGQEEVPGVPAEAPAVTTQPNEQPTTQPAVETVEPAKAPEPEQPEPEALPPTPVSEPMTEPKSTAPNFSGEIQLPRKTDIDLP